jgi:hypothetical protein
VSFHSVIRRSDRGFYLARHIFFVFDWLKSSSAETPLRYMRTARSGRRSNARLRRALRPRIGLARYKNLTGYLGGPFKSLVPVFLMGASSIGRFA